MPEAGQKFVKEMLDRLYAALSSGPSLNCRPHASRQRLDLHLVARLGDVPAEQLLAPLLAEKQSARLTVRLLTPPAEQDNETPQQQEARRAWQQQNSTLTKLRDLAEDARTFGQDTGAHALHVGFPLLHLPLSKSSSSGRGAGKRVLAPIAFIPVNLSVTRGRAAAVELACVGTGNERVIPNTALLAWIRRETGKPTEDLFGDTEGDDPYRELNAMVTFVKEALKLPDPGLITAETVLEPAPRSDGDSKADARIVPAAVLGLFPHSNQSLIADLEALAAGEPLQGPGEAFLRAVPAERAPAVTPAPARGLAEQYLVTLADPCQARTVRLARQAEILVVHGPPGTGKSQTIANMIGDHLARGQRVLLVCDKRIALDVVYHRLDRLGLGQLCAVVHSAQSDQRELYRSVRDQLDGLVEARPQPAAPGKLRSNQGELEKLHEQLAAYAAALTDRPAPAAASLHELMGRWLAQSAPSELQIDQASLAEVALPAGQAEEKLVRETLQRGQAVGYRDNPWTPAAGIELTALLERSHDSWRQRLETLRTTLQEVDATGDKAIPPFPAEGDVTASAARRAAFGAELARLLERTDAELIKHWAKRDATQVEQALASLDIQAGAAATLAQGPLDAELLPFHREAPFKHTQIAAWLLVLEDYLDSAARWYGFLYFQRKTAARTVLQQFGLRLRVTDAQRLRAFLLGVRARLALLDLHDTVLAPAPLAERFQDGPLARALDDGRALLHLLRQLHKEPALIPLIERVRQALVKPALREELLRGLQLAPGRAAAILRAATALGEIGLFRSEWLTNQGRILCEGKLLAPTITALQERLSDLEGVVRIRQQLAQWPKPLAGAVELLLARGAEVDEGWTALHQGLLGAEITRRLRAAPILQTVDAERLRASFDHYRELEDRQRGLVRDTILSFWIGRQRERLLASTGSRLNSQGAELRRRLFLRGDRAMRLRQVIRTGIGIEGGDPLFDMRPIWMAGPATVAELFPRFPIFDLVIFDEASQCRLEEALPVLARGQRVVIAGDPRQLPPTRFFESALAQSEEDEPENAQDLFESQQAEADDLLSAALNLAVEQSYLDVHYRSANADLIEFSNKNFYEARLQPIPGHPANRPRHAPILLHRANGVYEKRTNPLEAAKVVALVKERLQLKEPPSIGIACFNLSQRDLILDLLEEAAAEDSEFAEQLATARIRQGNGSFEGLFVRNLENVQGDERDCMIISTTYGPDPQGRFYRRFGPLGQAGGGRRLNVLVTRARQEVHLVTSFPAEVYRSLPVLPPGAVPSGGWLLFAYLNYAEQLEKLYAQVLAPPTNGQTRPVAGVEVQPTSSPSLLAEALAQRLADEQKRPSTVYWGNDGFCVDVALQTGNAPENVIGVLCDGCRYAKADDLVEWDIFRTAILEGQGWQLHRLWTPQLFRDVSGALAALVTKKP